MEVEAGGVLEGGGGGGGGGAWSSGPHCWSHGVRGGEAEKRRKRRWEVMGRDGWNGKDEVNFAVERAMRGLGFVSTVRQVFDNLPQRGFGRRNGAIA
jgi:hypothetical protein